MSSASSGSGAAARGYETWGDVVGAAAAGVTSPSPSVRREELGLTLVRDVERRRLEWLWPGRIPLGKVTLLVGDPGVGKSYVTLDLAARVSRGGRLPGEETARVPDGDVLLLSAEDDPGDTIRPRLERMKARLERVTVMSRVRGEERLPRLDEEIEVIDEALGCLGRPRLVIVDPISAYMGEADSHRNTEVRRVLAELGALARRRRVAVVAVTHLTKGSAGKALYRTMGSLAFTAAARSVLIVQRHPVEAEKRVVMPLKTNLASEAEAMTGHAYRIAAPGVVMWDAEPVRMRSEQLEETLSDRACGAGLAEAMKWLAGMLVGRDAQAASEVMEKAERDGITAVTLKRAKRRLGVVSDRDGETGRWTWKWGGEVGR